MDLQKHIEEKFGRGNSSKWKHSDFEDLSQEIWKATRERLSSKTLKRYFGKEKTNSRYSPQTETLKILAQYAGVEYIEEKKSKSIKSSLVLLFIFLAVIITTGIIFLRKDNIQAEIELIKVEGSTPTTAYFKVSIPETKDSVFINFGDNKPWKHITKNDSTISHIFYYPNRFWVSVQTRKERISEFVQVFCQTDGWELYGFVEQNRKKVYPIPIKPSINNGIFHASNELLDNWGIDIHKFFLSGLYNRRPFNASGDDFILQTRIKNTVAWPEALCQGFDIIVACENGWLKQHFNAPGCSFWLHCTYSDIDLRGNNQDISFFSIDFSRWRRVRIENKNMKTDIYVDNSLIHSLSYNKKLGKILGVNFNFIGSGYIDYFYIKNPDNSYALKEDFN